MKSRPWAAAGAGTSAAVGIALVAAGIGVLFRAMSPPAFSIAAAAAIAASGALAVLAWRAPRVAVGAAIGTAFALLPNEVYGCLDALGAPLASMSARSPTGDFGVAFIGAVVVFIGTVTALPFAALATAMGRRALGAIVVFAIAATLASAFVTVRGTLSMSRPEPDDFGRVFAQISPLDVGQRIVLGGTTLAYERSRDAIREPPTQDGWGVGPDGSVVALLPTQEMCILHLSGDAATSEVGLSAVDGRCPSLHALRDPESGVGLVLPADLQLAGATTSLVRPLAIFGTNDERAEIRISQLAGRLGAPRAWTFGAGVGLAFAAIAVAAAIGALRRRRALGAAVSATHLGGGWIALGDAKRHVAALEGEPPGPVVVTNATPARGATYRDDGSPHALSARTGTLEAMRDEIATRALAWSCVAIATIAITSAPLWMARLSGLL